MPTVEELKLIDMIANPIQEINKLSQISILQALISSPHALTTQLQHMADRATIPPALALEIDAIVKKMTTTAKLQELDSLINELRKKNPEQWRAVIFTGRRETQTSIEEYLRNKGIECGLINGDSGFKNQQTIANFKKNPPQMRVIVSTEAGSEGINLQVANVLVNFDLPWNPMIVEQRIGRIQRLASEHATVCVFNIILKGTFEQYIVARLMEKLQMVSQAVGDTEALLQAAGLDKDTDAGSFIEKIRELSVASLAGKNVEHAVLLAEKSITEAKKKLRQEEKKINELLGGMDNIDAYGPKCPKLPSISYSMNAIDFTIAALKNRGEQVLQSSGKYFLNKNGKQFLICFEETDNTAENFSILYKPGTASFTHLVNQIVNTGLHQVIDVDQDFVVQSQELGKTWVNSFQGDLSTCLSETARRCFTGTAFLRVRVTVAHDSYERLLEVSCCPSEEEQIFSNQDIELLETVLKNPEMLRLSSNYLVETALQDQSISSFCDFYLQRLSAEIKLAGDDDYKIKKLKNDFIPRTEVSLVGLEGSVYRQVKLKIIYRIESEINYESFLTIIPSQGKILNQPEMAKCSLSGKNVPFDCLAKCEISGKIALKHLLSQSQVSDRWAFPEYISVCALTNKRVLNDEIEKSEVTGKFIAKIYLKKSSLSGKCAESEFFGVCDFTLSEVLRSELAISQVSGKNYRVDEKVTSALSGKMGHQQEFIYCSESRQPLLISEAGRCEVTGKLVMPGLLETCELTNKKVLPSELEKSAVTGKRALRKFFVTSSLSSARLIEQEAICSVGGKFCAPIEAKNCSWSGRKCHPDDLKICQLTGLLMHFSFLGAIDNPCSEVLAGLLNGIRHKSDKSEIWETIEAKVFAANGQKHCKTEVAELSPDAQNLAVCLKNQTWMGIKIRHIGLFYSIKGNIIVGRIVSGKRTLKGWVVDD